MASIRKHKNGWRAEVARKGIRRSKVCKTRGEAKDWAAQTEHEILNADKLASAQPLGDMLDRYAREVSAGKRGARWEMLRIEAFRREDIAKTPLCDLTATDFATWRDQRLRKVSSGTVRREMTLLSGAMTVARKEWGLLSSNPMSDVRKPSDPKARSRRVAPDEIERLRISAGTDLSNATARTFHAFLFAIETAMRAGEIVGLTWDRVNLDIRVARLDRTKNGDARDVPLSIEAVRLLRQLPEADPIFGLREAQREALWRKLRDRAGVVGLTFHDSRAEALTRLSKRVDVLTLARIAGHRDIKMLMTYYRETAEDIAQRLG